MKFTLKQKMRLAVLMALASTLAAKTPPEALVEADKKELDTLTAACKAASLDPTIIAKEFAPDEDEGAPGVTDEELKNLITAAVAKAIPANSGVDTTALMTEIKSLGKGGLTVEAIEDAMKKHIGGTGIDKDALVKSIKDIMPAQGITSKELAEALDNFAKSVRTPSRMEHAATTNDADFPIEHRSGNMPVAQKQLLNLCVMNTSAQAQENSVKQNGGKPIAKSMNDGITEDQLIYARRQGELHIKRARHAVIYGGKVLTSTGAGSGAELVPSDLSSDLQARMYLESQLAAELLASEIDMPTQPFEFPLTTTRPNFYVGTENPGADPTASEPGTGNIQLDAKKLIGMSEYSYEADEDAIIAILPMIQEQLGAGAADAFEGALINGDTTGTHQDSDIHAVAAHHAKLFKGLRKYALAGNLKQSLATGGISADNIVAMRKMLKRWGIRPRDLMLLVGPQGYNDLVALDETLTFDKVGSASAARILTGEAASIYGIRIVVSSQVREDLNASGVYDGTTTTKGSMMLVHRPTWMVGSRRGFTVEVETDKKRQINSIIASFRRAFTPKETPSLALPSVVLGYNYDA